MFKSYPSRSSKRYPASKTNPSPLSSFPNSIQSSREQLVLSIYTPKSSKGKSNQSFIVKKSFKLQQSPDRKRDIPYSKRGELFADKGRTKPDEELLNMLKLTPTPKHTSSISVGDVRKRESPWSSPSSARPDRLRVAELESKLQRTTQRLKKLEFSYKQLLVKQLTAEHGTPCDFDYFTRSADSGAQQPSEPSVNERLDRLEVLCCEILEKSSVVIVRGKDYRPPGILAGTQWPGLETLYDSTYQLARLRPRASIEHLTTSDFLHAYLSDPEQALSQLQEKCLFANQLSGVRFQVADSEDQTMSETEQVDSESSFSRLSEIPTTGFDESWSKNTSKRRTISLLKGFAELSFASEPSEPLEPTLNSFVSATDSVCDAENRISVVSVEEAPHETSSIIEEGSMGVGMRMFLTGTASHNCFSLQPLKFVKLQQKVLSPLVTPHLTSTSLSFLGEAGGDFDQSPLIRKLIVCEKRLTQESIVELKLGLVCTGYQLALPLEFSNIENSSRAGVRYTANNDFAGLMYSLCLEVMLQHQVVSMASGHEHCVAVTTSGQVLTWGNGQSGCLGHGDRISRIEPTIVDGLRSVCVVAADCGAYHTAAVTLDGGLWTWGRGDAGQLGLAAARLEKDSIGVLSLAPAPVTYFTRKNMKVRAIACGEAHLLAVDRSGVVHACGWSEDGQTGLAPANPTNTKCPFGTAFRVDNDAVVKVSAGSLHSCALTGLGRLYVWGNGSQGQLGLGSKVTSTRTPTLISFLEQQTIIDVVCGDSSVLCLTDAFKVYGWGQGIAGHFGNRSASDDLSAKFPEGTEVICLQPRTIGEVDPVHRIIAGSSSGSLVWAAQTERAVRTGWMQDSEFKDTSSEV